MNRILQKYLIHKQQQQTRQNSHTKLECTLHVFTRKEKNEISSLLGRRWWWNIQHCCHSNWHTVLNTGNTVCLGHSDDSKIIHVSLMSMMTNHLPNWLWLKIGLTLKKVNEGQLLSMICITVSNLYCLWFMGIGKGHVCSFIIEVSSRGAGFCPVQCPVNVHRTCDTAARRQCESKSNLF